MGTIAEKLNKLASTKAAIKQALIDKGATPTDEFDTYADVINSFGRSTIEYIVLTENAEDVTKTFYTTNPKRTNVRLVAVGIWAYYSASAYTTEGATYLKGTGSQYGYTTQMFTRSENSITFNHLYSKNGYYSTSFGCPFTCILVDED